MKSNKSSLLLYAVTDATPNERDLYEKAEAALSGGATSLQFREKNLHGEELLSRALKLKALCKKYDVPFIVNDDVALAVKINADGVHVGQGDMPAEAVRRLMGRDKLLGVSVQTVAQAVRAYEQGADYLGTGAVFPTVSKSDAAEVSLPVLKDICRSVSIPVVAIGGICEENAALLAGSGICGIAVISAIFSASDVAAATARLKKAVASAVKRKGEKL